MTSSNVLLITDSMARFLVDLCTF